MTQGSAGFNILSNNIYGTICGTTQAIATNGTGQLSVELGGTNVSVFGDIVTAENTPVLQLDWVYGINSQLGVTGGTLTGVGDTNAARLRVQTGTNSAATAFYQSRRAAKYRAGQGMTARFTPVFVTAYTNSYQIMGVGNTQDGYFYGYSGTTFGILHRRVSVDIFYPQSSWTGDKCDGTGVSQFNWIPQYGSPVMIRYPYLGYGTIFFYVEKPTGGWINNHTIAYPNTSASLQILNPSLNFYAYAANQGNTNNLTMYTGSVGVFVNGQRSFVGNPKWAIENFKPTITAETNILTLKNATTYNGVTNRGLLRLQSISFASDGGNGVGTLRVKINATLGGTPSYTTINGTTSDGGVTITNGNSFISYDTAGTTVAGGTTVFNSSVSRSSQNFIDVTPFDIFLAPGETMTFTGTVGASATVSVATNWAEDQ